MTQPPIDLLPASIRMQCEAGARTGRLIVAIVAALLIVIVAATHARLKLERVRDQLDVARAEVEHVLAAEREVMNLSRALDEIRNYSDMHDRLAHPLEISALMATIINSLPSTVTLDNIEIDAGYRRPARIHGTAASHSQRTPRLLSGDLSGFAASDEEIAEVVARLQSMPAITAVSLDFSRSRTVHEVQAREFRLSFRMDLDRDFHVIAAQGGGR